MRPVIVLDHLSVIQNLVGIENDPGQFALLREIATGDEAVRGATATRGKVRTHHDFSSGVQELFESDTQSPLGVIRRPLIFGMGDEGLVGPLLLRKTRRLRIEHHGYGRSHSLQSRRDS